MKQRFFVYGINMNGSGMRFDKREYFSLSVYPPASAHAAETPLPGQGTAEMSAYQALGPSVLSFPPEGCPLH